MIKHNKKASWFVDNLGQMILMAVGLGIGFYFLWAYVLHGGGDSIAKLQECGSLTGNNGACKEACDKSIEYEFPDIGCKGLANKCCVLKDDNINELNLPTGYGGSDKYNFRVNTFEIDTVQAKGCEFTINRAECPKDIEIKIPVKISVTNIGTQTVSIYAEPLRVIADNSAKTKTVINTKTPITIDGKINDMTSDGVIETTITISVEDSNIEEKYLRIYPYVKCDTELCKKDGGDSKNRGVMVTDNAKSILVKFS